MGVGLPDGRLLSDDLNAPTGFAFIEFSVYYSLLR
jgi:hypothetical protein